MFQTKTILKTVLLDFTSFIDVMYVDTTMGGAINPASSMRVEDLPPPYQTATAAAVTTTAATTTSTAPSEDLFREVEFGYRGNLYRVEQPPPNYEDAVKK